MRLRKGNAKQGGVLVVTIVICALVGLMLTAYLAMVSSQHSFTQRSQVWNNAIPMCEAGIEAAMAHINHINTTSNFAINGWRYDGHYRKELYMNRGECRVTIDNSMPPIITAQGRLKEPIGDGNVVRAVRVQTKINFRFPNGILARGSVNLAGSGRVDSYNSTNDLESTDGKYDFAKATDRATVATVARTNGAVNVGNMSIYGSVGTGPGGTVLLSPQGNVGSTSFNNNSAYNGQIEKGHLTDDVNVYIPPSVFPTPFGLPVPQTPTAGPYPTLPPNTNYNLVVREGDWTINAISLSTSPGMIVTGKARLRVMGTTTVSGKASILIIPGASLEMYTYGVVSISGSGVINSSGVAKNFSIIGMTPASITYGGSAGFVGTIYAPSATVRLTGNSDAYGAIVANNFTLEGTMGLHYDEALKGNPREGRFLASSWREIQL